MNTNICHFHHHYDPKIQKKACASSNCNCKSGKALYPDKLELLKDQNIHLKNTKRDLEEQVKIIATKLRRQINQLKKDRLVGGKNTVTAQFEEDLDKLIEANIKLQDEEKALMTKVKKLQAKRKSELAQGKNLYTVAEQATIARANKQE